MIAPGTLPNRRGPQAGAAQKGIEIVCLTAPRDIRRAKGDAEGNRNFRSVFNVVRRGNREMQPEARLQVKRPTLCFEFVAKDEVAMGAAVVLLEFFPAARMTAATRS